MTSLFTRRLRRAPPRLTRAEEAELVRAADVARRKIAEVVPYAARSGAAIKSAQPI